MSNVKNGFRLFKIYYVTDLLAEFLVAFWEVMILYMP
jgi:hypothetical protein